MSGPAWLPFVAFNSNEALRDDGPNSNNTVTPETFLGLGQSSWVTSKVYKATKPSKRKVKEGFAGPGLRQQNLTCSVPMDRMLVQG